MLGRTRVIRDGRWPPLLLALALSGVTRPCRAQQSEALAIHYDAAASCPDVARFSELVREKLRAAGVDDTRLTLPRVEVALREADSGFTGRLTLRRSDGSSYERAVPGAACAEVANALAFVLALALSGKEPAAAGSDAPLAEPVAAPPPAPAAPAATPAAPPVPPSAEKTPVPPRLSEPAAPRRASPWSFAAGAELGGRAGIAPEWSLLEAAFLEIRRERSSAFALTLRGAFVNAATVSHTSATGSTEFRWWAGRFEACPVRARLRPALEIVPCAGMHVGRLLASGHPQSEPVGAGRRSSKLWWDAALTLRLELRLVHWLSVHAQGEALLPLTRYLFAFDGPDTPVYQVPRLASGGFLGLAGHFP